MYRVSEHGPAPLLAIEVLSAPIPGHIDLAAQSRVYARLEVAEHVLVDLAGVFLCPSATRLCCVPDLVWVEFGMTNAITTGA